MRPRAAGLPGVVFRGLLFCAFAIGCISPRTAGALVFLKFDGITGEAVDPGHEGWSTVGNVAWSITLDSSHTGGGIGGPNGDPKLSEVSWTQQVDSSTPPLFQRIANGTTIQDATVDFTRSIEGKAVTYFQMLFDDVVLTSLTLGSGGDTVSMSGAFDYRKIQMKYTPYDGNGKPGPTVSASFDRGKQGALAAAELARVYALGISQSPVVPEPSTAVLLCAGLGGLAWQSRRRAFRLR